MATPTLKAVTPPAGPTPTSAEPVIIYDLPAGVTQQDFDDLVARVEALENA